VSPLTIEMSLMIELLNVSAILLAPPVDFI